MPLLNQGKDEHLEPDSNFPRALRDGEYGKPETWREIVLVNPAISTTPPQLDRFVTELRRIAQDKNKFSRVCLEITKSMVQIMVQ